MSLWFDEARPSPGQVRILKKLEELRALAAEILFLPLREIEAQYAWYPVGGFYRRHLDNHAGDFRRKLTFVVYLNYWEASHGGELRLYPPLSSPSQTTTSPISTDFTDIAPVAGNIVLFRSQDIPHEVLQTNRERISVTGWFRVV